MSPLVEAVGAGESPDDGPILLDDDDNVEKRGDDRDRDQDRGADAANRPHLPHRTLWKTASPWRIRSVSG